MSVPYQYVLLRCVPRVDREEFLNVGVLLYSQTAEVLTLESHLDRERLHAAFPELDIDCAAELLEHLSDLVGAIDRGEAREGLGDRGKAFGWLTAPRSTVIQPGPLHGGLAADPREECRVLARRLLHGAG